MLSEMKDMAKVNDVGPETWLTCVLQHPSDHKINQIHELMPWRFAVTTRKK